MPFTSKQDYVQRLFDILNPVLPHFRANNTRLLLGYTGAAYDTNIAEIEGFTRVLWGLAPYLSGGGSSTEFENIYLQGFAYGSNPSGADYWGDAEDGSQLLVEMAAIAVGLLLAPEKLWEPLSQEAKENLASWLAIINYREPVSNNWQFFLILVNVALLKLGSPHFSQEALDRGLANINSYYVGNGWYKDGVFETYDYYAAFAMHYYGLIYSVFMADEDPVNSQAFRERAMLFGPQFVYWFDESGSGVPFGRSLTYRFAEVAFFSACIFAGIEPLPMAVMKGIIDRNLDWWWESHMQDFSGILSIGYEYPNLIMSEIYNAPGSPLWALKSFLLLALDDSHPYWSLSAAQLPTLDPVRTFREAQMIISNVRSSATLFPGGYYLLPYLAGHMEEKYAKFAYSTKYGFSIRRANDCLENMAPDSDLVFEIGGLFFGRNKATGIEIGDGTITTHWSPFPGIDVTTVITPTAYGYSRQHTVVSSLQCTAYDCGFSLPLSYANYGEETSDTTAHVQNDYGACTVYIYNPAGSGYQTQGLVIEASPNTNLLFPRTVIPAVSHSINVGTTSFLTTVLLENRV